MMKKRKFAQGFLRTIGLWGGVVVFIIGFVMDIASSNSANTSVLHLGGAAIMIIGALMIGKKFKELLDVGIGAVGVQNECVFKLPMNGQERKKVLFL